MTKRRSVAPARKPASKGRASSPARKPAPITKRAAAGKQRGRAAPAGETFTADRLEALAASMTPPAAITAPLDVAAAPPVATGPQDSPGVPTVGMGAADVATAAASAFGATAVLPVAGAAAGGAAPPIAPPVQGACSEGLMTDEEIERIAPSLAPRIREAQARGERVRPLPGYHFALVLSATGRVLVEEPDPPAASAQVVDLVPPTSIGAALARAKQAASARTETCGHDWRKTNLVTISKGGSMYDTYACQACRATAKRHGVQWPPTLDPGQPATCPKVKAKAPAPAAAKPPRAVAAPAASAGYGSKPGTAAAWTKDLLMERPRTNAEVHALLVKELGKDGAGLLKSVGWYRNWLKRNGHVVPGTEA